MVMSKYHSKTISIKGPRRRLKSGWTIEKQSPIFDVYDETANTMAEGIQKVIDAEVLWNMLKSAGWVYVEISYYTDNNHAIDISEWIESNVRHRHMRSNRQFIFESEQDANWFKIRWL